MVTNILIAIGLGLVVLLFAAVMRLIKEVVDMYEEVTNEDS